MADPHTGQDPTTGRAGARRLPLESRAGARSFAIAMALWAAVLTLLTACFVVLVLLLDSRARRWEEPVVFGVGLFTVLFFGWAIYSTVHTSVVQARIPNGPGDTVGSGNTAPTNSGS
jgi:hypothetical protein